MVFWKKPPPPMEPQLLSGNLVLFGYPAPVAMFGIYIMIHMLGYLIIVSGFFDGSSIAKKPHLAAHFLPQLIGFMLLAYYGGGAWLTAMPEAEPGPGEYLYVGERIAMHMLAFQLYELVACIPAPVYWHA